MGLRRDTSARQKSGCEANVRKCRETEAFWVPFTQNIDAGTEKELRTRTRGASTEMLVREGTRSQPLDRAKMDLMDDSAGRGWGSAHTPPTGETGKSEQGRGAHGPRATQGWKYTCGDNLGCFCCYVWFPQFDIPERLLRIIGIAETCWKKQLKLIA